MKVLLDTNVLVSAHATRGLCADLLRRILADHELLVAEVVLVETKRVLRETLHVPASAVAQIEQDLRGHTVVPKPAAPSAVPIRDPDDQWVLASAEAAGADLVVSGDEDPLTVASESAIPILSPRGAWDLLNRRR